MSSFFKLELIKLGRAVSAVLFAYRCAIFVAYELADLSLPSGASFQTAALSYPTVGLRVTVLGLLPFLLRDLPPPAVALDLLLFPPGFLSSDLGEVYS